MKKQKLLFSKTTRIIFIIFIWLLFDLLSKFGFFQFNLESWMFSGLFTVLIPTSSALAGLIAIFFDKHYKPFQKINPREGNKKFSELKNDFRNLLRNLLTIAAVSVVLLPFSKILGLYEYFSLAFLVLIGIILFALYTFYDTYEFIKKSTAVHLKLELMETISVKE